MTETRPDCPECGAPHGYPPAGPCPSHPAPERRWSIKSTKNGAMAGEQAVVGPETNWIRVIPEQDAERLRRENKRLRDFVEGVAKRYDGLVLGERARAALEEKGKLDG